MESNAILLLADKASYCCVPSTPSFEERRGGDLTGGRGGRVSGTENSILLFGIVHNYIPSHRDIYKIQIKINSCFPPPSSPPGACSSSYIPFQSYTMLLLSHLPSAATATLIFMSTISISAASPPPTAFTYSTPTARSRSATTNRRRYMVPPTKSNPTIQEINAESELLRKEIEELRKEAFRRLEDLDEKLGVSSIGPYKSLTSTEPSISSTATTKSEEGLLPAPPPIVFTKSAEASKKPKKGISNLLDETKWKVSLSIGREPGTWMPKDWGVSGQRLNLSFTAEFTPSQLYEKDEFFRGGYTNAKIMHVVGNEVTLGPSISEGQRLYKVKNGGWQVSQGDGPLGTDLLRFFIELDEEVTHTGSDLYIPKGRVYCSCGYFPLMSGRQSREAVPSMKESFTKELKEVDEQIQKLREKKAEMNPFNMDRLKVGSEIGRLLREAERIQGKIAFAAVREPDKNLLRFSEDADVGLTREGGVCCRVAKGPMMEYHILGRFGVKSVESDKRRGNEQLTSSNE